MNALAFKHIENDFGIDDLEFVVRDGVDSWIANQSCDLTDQPLDIRTLSTAQQMLVMNLAGIGIEYEYCVVFRRHLRVFLFALLPRVERVTRTERVERPVFDPVIPFIYGWPEPAQRQHAAAIAGFLRTANPDHLNSKVLYGILEDCWQRLSKSEIAYYLIAMRSLATGTWRHAPAFADVVALKERVIADRFTNPSQVVIRGLLGD